MARALLVSYSGYPFTPSSLTPDNGLANLAGALVEAGHEPRVLDFGTVSMMRRLFPAEMSAQFRPLARRLLDPSGPPAASDLAQLQALSAALEQHQADQVVLLAEELAAEARRFRPDLVAFKLWNGDGFTGSVALAERLRSEFPGLPLYGGGPQASWFREAILQRTDVFAALAYGEGEHLILDLVEHAQGRRDLPSIPGLLFRADGELRRTDRVDDVDLKLLPAPVYDPELYPAMAGEEKIKIIVLDDSRGCPFGCGFCMHPIESGRVLRTTSASLLADRMEQLGQAWGFRAFRFSGSSTPGSLMRETAEEITRRGLDVAYTCFGHFASADQNHFEAMAASGLKAIFFGLESGCQEVLDRAVGKHIKLTEVKETIRKAQQAGIFTVASMIVPLPFDTEETLQESLDFLRDLRPDSVPVQFPGLVPGTPWWQNPEKYNLGVDRSTILDEVLDYKIKLLYPPAYWKPLPYTVNGLTYAEFTAITAKFAGALEAAGISTGIPDDNALLAQFAGVTPVAFRDLSRALCLTGDADAMAALVTKINQQAVRPGATS
ncbi:MAG TPA: radical SAM protein [Armatimonadota bacterium]|jgi:radical SAM superfamily enzyme YgiQ (UPF0313 family)